MSTRPKYPKWLLAIFANPTGAFVVALVLLVLALIALYAIDSRLQKIENQIAGTPLANYTPPNLEAFSATDFDETRVTEEATIYIPAYSHIYLLSGSPYPLAATLSVRNTDPDERLYIKSVQYFDTSGNLVHDYLDRTIQLKPLETIEFFVAAEDSRGGSGANFLVNWATMAKINKPIVEAVMVGVQGSHSLSFRTVGTPIEK